jgi:hypothetical protein
MNDEKLAQREDLAKIEILKGECMTEEYKSLACGIIRQACEDYRRALKNIRKYKHDEEANYMRIECERFLKSDWFSVLSDLDGEQIIRKIREKVEHDSEAILK